MAKKNIMDALAGLSDPSDSEADASDEPEQEVPPKKQKRVTLEDLEATGYTTQNTVLFMKAPAEQQQLNTQWGDGKAQKAMEAVEDHEERRRTAEAATTRATEEAVLAMKAKQQSELLRQAAAAERERQHEEKRKQSWNEKEKKKRKEGKVARDGSTVEEEKRIARNFGVYSGFD